MAIGSGQRRTAIGPGLNFPEVHLFPFSVTSIVGGLVGTVADIQDWQDGNVLQIQEAAATPAQNVEVLFKNVKSFRRVGVGAYYMGSATHWIEVQVYDFNAMVWKTLHTIENSNGINYRYTDIPPNMHDLIDANGDVKIRFYHPIAGNAAHNTYVDYVSLVV